MKDQTTKALVRSKQALAKARKLLELEMFDIAGRQAYIASLTAARALIYERMGKASKTHRGVKTVMHEMVRKGLPIDRALLVVLEYGFELKNTADYGDSETISIAEAEKALELALGFVARIEELVSAGG
jgi:uncharacterized protein (UPF0332 family)